jgi:ribosome-associated protein
MTAIKDTLTTDQLTSLIIEGIKEKKGLSIIDVDLNGIANAICERFVICHGGSRTHADAIANGLQEHVRKHSGVRSWHSEGYENAEWILIDYVNVVVHVFQKETRNYYKLEELWADARISEYDSEE